MKPIGMPAYRLTADCIWNSFRSSGKRHLILTGSRGSGKTTLLQSLFPEPCPGLTTWAQPQNAVYLRDNLSGETMAVGVFDPSLPGPGNQMVPLETGFATLGVAVLENCMKSDSPWVTIDEVGYLEDRSSTYQGALLQLLERKQVAMVVRKQALPFLRKLLEWPDAFVVDLDAPFGNIGCVIMASGLGKRFGGNKLMADFRGKPLIRWILDATEGIFSRRIVVTRHREVAQLCRDLDVPVLLHALPHRSDTVHLGLEALAGVDRCLFTPADQPLLSRETLAALALASKNCPDILWRTLWEETPGSPVVFPRWTFEALSHLPQGKGGSFVLRQYPERLRTVHVRQFWELKDIDTPEDLETLSM